MARAAAFAASAASSSSTTVSPDARSIEIRWVGSDGRARDRIGWCATSRGALDIVVASRPRCGFLLTATPVSGRLDSYTATVAASSPSERRRQKPMGAKPRRRSVGTLMCGVQAHVRLHPCRRRSRGRLEPAENAGRSVTPATGEEVAAAAAVGECARAPLAAEACELAWVRRRISSILGRPQARAPGCKQGRDGDDVVDAASLAADAITFAAFGDDDDDVLIGGNGDDLLSGDAETTSSSADREPTRSAAARESTSRSPAAILVTQSRPTARRAALSGPLWVTCGGPRTHHASPITTSHAMGM